MVEKEILHIANAFSESEYFIWPIIIQFDIVLYHQMILNGFHEKSMTF